MARTPTAARSRSSTASARRSSEICRWSLPWKRRSCSASVSRGASAEFIETRQKRKRYAGNQESAREGRQPKNPQRREPEGERRRGPFHYGPQRLRKEHTGSGPG